jgi:hypothetical protein
VTRDGLLGQVFVYWRGMGGRDDGGGHVPLLKRPTLEAARNTRTGQWGDHMPGAVGESVRQQTAGWAKWGSVACGLPGCVFCLNNHPPVPGFDSLGANRLENCFAQTRCHGRAPKPLIFKAYSW